MTKNENNTTIYEKLKIFTDGGSRGNPGPSASGYVIMTTDDELIESGGEYLGVTTNNQAEYHALKLALSRAVKYSPSVINFYLDSELVVKQMNGIYKIRNRDLWPIHSDIKKITEKIEQVHFNHVMREYNNLADSEVNKILDTHDYIA